MKLKERIIKEKKVWPLFFKGYSRSMACAWVRKMQADMKNNKTYEKNTIRDLHAKGYLSSSIERYDLLGKPAMEYITDFEYMYLKPFNNTYSKWLEDILTTNRILEQYKEHCREVYYSIISRDGKQLILKIDNEDREYSAEDILKSVQEKGELELRPAFWSSGKRRYSLKYQEERLYINDEISSERVFAHIIEELRESYIVAEKIDLSYTLPNQETVDHYLKFWVANDCGTAPRILFSTVRFYWNEGFQNVRKNEVVSVELETGRFVFDGMEMTIPGWKKIQERIQAISDVLKAITYFTCTIAVQEDGTFQFLNFSGDPSLPEIAFDADLNDYLKAKVTVKRTENKPNFSSRWKKLKNWMFERYVDNFCRHGIRPYMQQLWLTSVKDDFLHTKGSSLSQKIWCWKRGYLSFRKWQYNLTEDNFQKLLSDYDYHYLNRINNMYQKWINDKTTTRFVLNPFKEHIPDYYFHIIKRGGQTELIRMWDCPEDIPASYDGLLEVLRREGRLAMKASAGTHGDGFYCLAFENGAYFVNGDVKTEEQIVELIKSFESYYVVTEYIEMHSWLKQIYSKSVNTIRIMVINRHGHDPKIMQTYMRIGSSRTGYTDNVGYGGICAMVNKETGELYKPETLVEHRFYDCPNHPDTNTPISGELPNWNLVCKRVLDISRYLCELEYLGFDIAITEEGFYLLEINIHQDLHKVAELDEEVLEFFHDKLEQKKAKNKIK